MSYFTLDTENKQINTNNKPMSEASDKTNPRFSGHCHSDRAKKAISESQTKRYEMIRKLVRKGMAQPLTEERVKEICSMTIDEYIKKNAFQIKDNKPKPMNINL